MSAILIDVEVGAGLCTAIGGIVGRAPQERCYLELKVVNRDLNEESKSVVGCSATIC